MSDLKFIDNKVFQTILQSGLLIVFLTGLAYLIGYRFEEGVYNGFGIAGINPSLGVSVYIKLLQNMGQITIPILVLSGFKDNMINFFEHDKKTRKKKVVIIAAVVLLMFIGFLWIINFLSDGHYAGRAIKDTWNTNIAYIALIFLVGFMAYNLVVGVRKSINADKIITKVHLKVLHYAIEGTYLLLIAIAGLMIASVIAEHLGRQSITTDSKFALFSYLETDYLVVHDQADTVLAVKLCSKDPVKIVRGNFRYVRKDQITQFDTSSANLKPSSFC